MKQTGTNYDTLPRRELFERGVFSRNPVLVRATGLCPLIAVATTAKNAVVIAVITALLLLINELLASLLIKRLPKWVRLPIYFLVGGACLLGAHIFLEAYIPTVVLSLGIYLMLLASNTIIVFRCENCAIHSKPSTAILDALANALGYGFVLVLVGVVREALGYSKVFGVYIDSLPKAEGALMPFFGFIVLGFVAAFIAWLRNRFLIGEHFDTREEVLTQDVTKKIADSNTPIEETTTFFVQAESEESITPDSLPIEKADVESVLGRIVRNKDDDSHFLQNGAKSSTISEPQGSDEKGGPLDV